DDDAIMLSDKLSQKSAQVILKAIDGIKKGDAKFIEQNEADATYAPKLQKEHGLIDWQMSSEEIFNRIRAFVPWPGCFTYWNKKILKIWKAAPEEGVSGKDVSPGRVIDVAKDSILVGTGKAAIRIEELQLESKRRMKVEEFIVGHSDMKSGVTFSLQR
ncbi:MAG: methionyl-tRNA formyltransferase, partial [Candidatus Omnitrophota bacterium]|nr:methionyl-tRNA formyltransferase [Candidatus Omnitrophota bacterium]